MINETPFTTLLSASFMSSSKAANFDCNQFSTMQGINSKLLHTAIWSCYAVWLESEQRPFSFWTRSQFLCPNFTQRLMIDRTALVSNKFQQNLSKFHFTWEKNQLSQPKNLQSIYTILTLELSQYYKSGSTFSSIADSCNCYLFANTLCFCFSVWPAEAVQECGQKI